MDMKLMDTVKKIQTTQKNYVVFGRMTNMPFVICNEETFNDQVWVFTDQKKAIEFCEKRKEERKEILTVAQIDHKYMAAFYGGLFMIAVNEIVFCDENGSTCVNLEDIVKKPDFSKQPVDNCVMHLTGLYLAQELSRAVPNSEKPQLMDLKEEMESNLVKTKFLVPVVVKGGEVLPDRSNVGIPFVATKDNRKFRPLFTDIAEFQKFNKKNEFRINVIEFRKLMPLLGDDMTGIAINPMGMNLMIQKEAVPMICKRFED